MNLCGRLRDLGMSFSRSEYPTLVKIGNRYLELYSLCLEELLNPAQFENLIQSALHDIITEAIAVRRFVAHLVSVAQN